MKVGIGVGTNQGKREEQIREALAFLKGLTEGEHFLCSSIWETEPVDCPIGSQCFLNCVVEIETSLSSRNLLQCLQDFELSQGRLPLSLREKNGPRPIDLDILYYGSNIIVEPDLLIPHPRISQRRFVLGPLAEIRPELILPGYAKTIKSLLHELDKNNNRLDKTPEK
ncbi:7,8-dihydro-6-hydroxymethylpterin-pyrophosphokinase [Methylacidiphilum kamchatkense Kam1]|uniref:2-amino-4-hydroxy-6-hydroxymethyldihydropteridine pyrophosphokinase n=1 Tax=Methylacidiphilum kamchatkense Kam1 TaxID=1202785 RepID=A0A0C1URV6_9BACT|nr:2-amino-4-hydroxy-6-hydroxymethyldihydropteridine diphosphokinase [Methylacidiphilum kamchatkense]KIE59049.1 7,8-dihydro-6-hydroxymethylpterin-pyrophosphokinase [Methylacidiphilum kamchatkense Kam1]QDQ43050.1 2-amino-4-hydroxy-6-hydroxymethyldihydropteridine diphosphokinase [Methylacidiphilum kamchatkense Kam1]